MHEHVTLKVRGWTGTYTYLNHVPDLQLGDYCVVMAPADTLKLAKVVDTAPKRQQVRKADKWIVDRIDMDKYRALSALAPPESFEEDDDGSR